VVDVRVSGRSVVVGPGAPAPPAWDGCERVAVEAVDAAVADRLSQAWRRRDPIVVELRPGLGLDDPLVPPDERVTGLQPWQLAVDLDLVGERLHHAVWANAADARVEGGTPRYRWVEEAVALGATVAADGTADVVLPDGSPALCDGGPLDAALPGRAGVAVVHRIAVEHGSLRPLGPNVSGADLAPDQLAAVTHPGAGCRVIAPAGSGKTRVLTERARVLLSSWGVPAPAMALVAFNRRAAAEITARTGDLGGLRVRTLNALGLRLLPAGVRTVDERRVRDLLAGLVDMPRRAETDPAAPWIEALGQVRLGLRDPLAVEDDLPDVSGLGDVTVRYRDALRSAGETDFDDQVVGAVERLLGDPPFRRRAQRAARLLLVDEFQDLTPAHLLLLRLLSGPAGGVFGVGDDDQTIYGYAGATPRWLVSFDERFPGSGDHPLEVNYRCPPAVVAAASNLLTRNAVRVPKVIRPAPGAADEPGALRVLAAGDAAARAAERVEELLAGGDAAPADVAVLARVNASLAPVQVLLRHAGVAVRGGVDARFLQRSGVRAALAWLAVASAPEQRLPSAVLQEAARRPKRGMSRSLLGLLAKQRSVKDLLSLADWLEGKGSTREADKVSDLGADVARARKVAEAGTTADVLRFVRDEVGNGGLDASAAALDQWSHGAVSSHTDDLDALAALAHLEPDPSMFGAWLGDALAAGDDEDGVTLASIHAVKGQEWPHVVLVNVTAGLLPHRLVDDEEEERRVLHVGLTRGRRTVTVVPGQQPSPFLAELDAPGEPKPARREATTGPARAPVTPAASSKQRSDGPTWLLAAARLRFQHGGYDHEIVEIADHGAVTTMGGGASRTTLPFGSVVHVDGTRRLLAHPGAETAFERLRQWRAGHAIGKPAYTVFADATLRELAAVLPTTEAQLSRVKGIGPTKLQLYGDELLSLFDDVRATG
jgi:DNA helicase-2/ATP-dependent DNA helicase PcrA